jgi:threonine dehydratase
MTTLQFANDLLKNEPWVPTPLLPAKTIGDRLGVELWLKREDCTPVGSFKLRGALVSMARRGDEMRTRGVYVASAGNYGLAMAVAGQRRGVEVTVVVPLGATPSKLERIRLCGATVIEHDADFDGAKEFARTAAADAGAAFWEDGIIEEMAHGAATISQELLTHPEPWDYVLVPVGNGSLIKGVASVFKDEHPATRVVGLVPSGAPSMAQGIRGEPWDEGAPMTTIADGLAVRVPIRPIVQELKALVDEVWLVNDEKLLPAVLSLMELEQVMVEPSAAITLAGLADHSSELSGKRVVAIMTGAHLRQSLMSELLTTEGLL